MKAIFISGGAGAFGQAVARKFVDNGYVVGLGDLQRRGALEGVDNVHFFHLDVTDPDSWAEALGGFMEVTGGRLDVFDNNAGIIDDHRIAAADPATIHKVIDVNAYGLTLGARAAYPYLKATPGSQLINMGSISACYGIPDVGVYAATKAYTRSLTETLAAEWRKEKIRVYDVNPLWAKTPISEVNSKSIRSLGVNLTGEDIANGIWRASQARSPWARGRLHWGVSAADIAARIARNSLPDRVAKWVYRVVAG